MNKKRQAETNRAQEMNGPVPDANRAVVGNRIRQYRLAKEWTLTELQNRSGVNNGNLSKIERGLQTITTDTLTALAKALGVTMAQLVDGTQALPTSPRASSKKARHTQAMYSNVCKVEDFESVDDIPETSNVAIGIVEARPDAEKGGLIFRRSERSLLLFHGGTIGGIQALTSNLASFQIGDELMAPRLFKGDTVVLDLGDTVVPETGGVFGLSIDGETIIVRRVVPYINRGLRIVCDNRNYSGSDITLSAAQVSMIQIAGRVKAMQGTGGF